MKRTLLTITCLLVNVYSFNMPYNDLKEKEIGKLSLVITIIRHGARTPVQIIRGDPNNAYWTDGKGQLTNIGKNELFAIGKKFRKEYSSFLNVKYTPEETLVKSTVKDRTIMSAQCFLAGLYPPTGTQVWNPNLAWQPIPVYLLDYHVAKEFGGALDEAMKDCIANYGNAFDAIYERFKVIILLIEKATGERYSCLDKGFSLTVNTLAIETFYNLTMPFGLHLYSNEIFKLREAMFVMKTTFPEVVSSVNALIWNEIVKNLEKHQNNSTSKKLFAYFVHDVNILPLLMAITYSDPKPPLFAASVTIEVYQKTKNDYYVKVLHRKSPWSEVELETIKKCGKICPLNSFLALIKEVNVPPKKMRCPCYTTKWPRKSLKEIP